MAADGILLVPGPLEPGASCPLPWGWLGLGAGRHGPPAPARAAGTTATIGSPELSRAQDDALSPTASSCLSPPGNSPWLGDGLGEMVTAATRQYQGGDGATGPSLQLGRGPCPVPPFHKFGITKEILLLVTPKLPLPFLFLPHDSGISAGLGGEEA